jgi:hypothetical protein
MTPCGVATVCQSEIGTSIVSSSHFAVEKLGRHPLLAARDLSPAAGSSKTKK